MSTSNTKNQIADNLHQVQSNIEAAAIRSGRTVKEIELISVTKYVDIPTIEILLQLGCQVFGESRPQTLWEKADYFSKNQQTIQWHMIGNLQRNKAKKTLPNISVLHSGNSIRLLETLNDLLQKNETSSIAGKKKILLEINISQDDSKHGFTVAEFPVVLEACQGFEQLEILGLMTMAARDGDMTVARSNFSELRELRDRYVNNSPENVQLHHLSMGMSRDYEIAIEEGATMVRVGSGLFKGI